MKLLELLHMHAVRKIDIIPYNIIEMHFKSPSIYIIVSYYDKICPPVCYVFLCTGNLTKKCSNYSEIYQYFTIEIKCNGLEAYSHPD